MLGSGKPQRSSSSLASDQIGRAEPSSEPAYNHLAQKTFEACDIAVLHQIMQHQRDDHADTQQFHERNETHADHGDLLYSKIKKPRVWLRGFYLDVEHREKPTLRCE